LSAPRHGRRLERRRDARWPRHAGVGADVSCLGSGASRGSSTAQFRAFVDSVQLPVHDLSARVRVEEQLREQAALAKLGEMAAVIAHEVKNPLAGIRGAMQVMGRRMTAGSKDEELTREIVKRIDSLDAIRIQGQVFHPRFAPRSSHLSSRRSHVALVSACPRPSGSSRRTMARSRSTVRPRVERPCTSPCRSTPPSGPAPGD